MSHLQGGGWSEGGFGTKKELGAREENQLSRSLEAEWRREGRCREDWEGVMIR